MGSDIRRQFVNGVADQPAHIDIFKVERDLPRRDLFKVQDVVDDRSQPVDVRGGDVHQPLRGGGMSSPPVARISPSAPLIEVSGVRNSWLTVATNSFFICSTFFWSVMSRTCAT